jgi:hypothetical protein
MQEGYIKFNINWTRTPAEDRGFLDEIIYWRNWLWHKGLIGVNEEGIGFGNISIRAGKAGFFISGSATGHIAEITTDSFCKVYKYDFTKNKVWCRGPVVASSESLSHAAVYENCQAAHCVIHIHHKELWENLLGRVPTTHEGATYGTPEMALSIAYLFRHTALESYKILVMRSHEEGLIVFGENPQEATSILNKYLIR